MKTTLVPSMQAPRWLLVTDQQQRKEAAGIAAAAFGKAYAALHQHERIVWDTILNSTNASAVDLSIPTPSWDGRPMFELNDPRSTQKEHSLGSPFRAHTQPQQLVRGHCQHLTSHILYRTGLRTERTQTFSISASVDT